MSLFRKLDIYKCVHMYSKNTKHKELEYIIGCDVGWSYMYVCYVIHGEFKLGEEIIASDVLTNNYYQEFLERL